MITNKPTQKEIEQKEQWFENYIDDLRYLGAKIPYLHWDINESADIYLLWDKIEEDCQTDKHPHRTYTQKYKNTINELVNYFNLTHQI